VPFWTRLLDHRDQIANTVRDGVPGKRGSAVDALESTLKSGGRYSALADELSIRGKHRCPWIRDKTAANCSKGLIVLWREP
jgi:hypothetical protein